MADLFLLLLPILIVSIGAILQASVGYGFALVSAPLLVLINPELVPGPLIFSSLFLMFLVARRNRLALAGHNVYWLVLGLALGTPVGLVLLQAFHAKHFGIIFSIIIVAAMSISLLNRRVPVTPFTQGIAGFLGSVMGTVTSVGGPPVALLYQYETGPRIRAVLSLLFFIASFFSLAGLALVDRFGIAEIKMGTQLLPGIIVGYAIGPKLAVYLDRGYSRWAIMGLSLSGVVLLLLRTLLENG